MASSAASLEISAKLSTPDPISPQLPHPIPVRHPSSLQVITGTLWKQSSGFVKRWQPRIFTLLSTGSVVYKHPENEEIDRQTIMLTPQSIAKPLPAEVNLSRQHVFTLVGHCKGEQRVLYLSADTAESAAEWVSQINEVIQRTIQLDSSSPLLLADLALDEVLKRGSVLRKSTFGLGTWKSRYLVLSAKTICQYSNKDDRVPNKVTRLTSSTTCSAEADNTCPGKFVFSVCVESDDGEGKGEVWLFAVDSDQDRAEWMEQVRHAICAQDDLHVMNFARSRGLSVVKNSTLLQGQTLHTMNQVNALTGGHNYSTLYGIREMNALTQELDPEPQTTIDEALLSAMQDTLTVQQQLSFAQQITQQQQQQSISAAVSAGLPPLPQNKQRRGTVIPLHLKTYSNLGVTAHGNTISGYSSSTNTQDKKLLSGHSSAVLQQQQRSQQTSPQSQQFTVSTNTKSNYSNLHQLPSHLPLPQVSHSALNLFPTASLANPYQPPTDEQLAGVVPPDKDDLLYTHTRTTSGYARISQQSNLLLRRGSVTSRRLYMVLSKTNLYVFNQESDATPHGYLTHQRCIRCFSVVGAKLTVLGNRVTVEPHKLSRKKTPEPLVFEIEAGGDVDIWINSLVAASGCYNSLHIDPISALQQYLTSLPGKQPTNKTPAARSSLTMMPQQHDHLHVPNTGVQLTSIFTDVNQTDSKDDMSLIIKNASPASKAIISPATTTSTPSKSIASPSTTASIPSPQNEIVYTNIWGSGLQDHANVQSSSSSMSELTATQSQLHDLQLQVELQQQHLAELIKSLQTNELTKVNPEGHLDNIYLNNRELGMTSAMFQTFAQNIDSGDSCNNNNQTTSVANSTLNPSSSTLTVSSPRGVIVKIPSASDIADKPKNSSPALSGGSRSSKNNGNGVVGENTTNTTPLIDFHTSLSLHAAATAQGTSALSVNSPVMVNSTTAPATSSSGDSSTTTSTTTTATATTTTSTSTSIPLLRQPSAPNNSVPLLRQSSASSHPADPVGHVLLELQAPLNRRQNSHDVTNSISRRGSSYSMTSPGPVPNEADPATSTLSLRQRIASKMNSKSTADLIAGLPVDTSPVDAMSIKEGWMLKKSSNNKFNPRYFILAAGERGEAFKLKAYDKKPEPSGPRLGLGPIPLKNREKNSYSIEGAQSVSVDTDGLYLLEITTLDRKTITVGCTSDQDRYAWAMAIKSHATAVSLIRTSAVEREIRGKTVLTSGYLSYLHNNQWTRAFFVITNTQMLKLYPSHLDYEKIANSTTPSSKATTAVEVSLVDTTVHIIPNDEYDARYVFKISFSNGADFVCKADSKNEYNSWMQTILSDASE